MTNQSETWKRMEKITIIFCGHSIIRKKFNGLITQNFWQVYSSLSIEKTFLSTPYYIIFTRIYYEDIIFLLHVIRYVTRVRYYIWWWLREGKGVKKKLKKFLLNWDVSLWYTLINQAARRAVSLYNLPLISYCLFASNSILTNFDHFKGWNRCHFF